MRSPLGEAWGDEGPSVQIIYLRSLTSPNAAHWVPFLSRSRGRGRKD
jgi:hypothetical protein